MKQFSKIVLAVVVGSAIYDIVDGGINGMINVIQRKKKHRQRTERSDPIGYGRYGSEEYGRRTIGFKMKEDE